MRKQIQKSFIECFPTKNPQFSSRPPQTPSFPAATVKENDDEQFLFQNIRSFYRNQCEEELTNIGREASPQRITDFSAANRTGASQAAAEPVEEVDPSVQDDYITILTYSQSPHEDFRRSMQEMVEARLEQRGEVDREFMEELLFRYLDLNNEKFYGCIVRAFLDLIVVSREDAGRSPARRRPWMGRGGRTGADPGFTNGVG